MYKKFIYTVALTFSMLLSSTAYSGAGHSHGSTAPPTDQQIITKASQDLEMIIERSELVEGKKLDASWEKVTSKKVHKKTLRHYITAFSHPTENKTLYILLNAQGTFLKANYSGKFEGI